MWEFKKNVEKYRWSMSGSLERDRSESEWGRWLSFCKPEKVESRGCAGSPSISWSCGTAWMSSFTRIKGERLPRRISLYDSWANVYLSGWVGPLSDWAEHWSLTVSGTVGSEYITAVWQLRISGVGCEVKRGTGCEIGERADGKCIRYSVELKESWD